MVMGRMVGDAAARQPRDRAFDVVRVVALWMILLCHLLSHCSFSLAAPLHDVLAQGGNGLFFALSGCLLGRKWIADGCGSYGFAFVRHRVARIWITFAAFVVPYVAFLLVRGHPISVRQAAFNVLGLSKFAPLPAAGHLWFVTGILFFYLTLLLVSRVGPLMRRHPVLAVPCSLLFAVGVQFVFKTLNIGFAGLVQFAWGGGVLFVFADRLHAVSGMVLVACAAIVPLGAWLLGWGLPAGVLPTARVWVSFAMAAAVIALTLKACRGRAVPAWVTWMSAVSFEVYLVHCVFLEDVVFPFGEFLGNGILYTFNYLLASFAFAWLLHRVTGIVSELVAGGARKSKSKSKSVETTT